MVATTLIESFSLVSLAEMGDKTQLLSILLAARLRRRGPVLMGILCATLLNHGFTAWLGSEIGSKIDPYWLNIGAAAMLIITGLWTLVPDGEPTLEKASKHGAFLTSFIAFFLAEMGDKTQLATLTLGARFADTWLVVLGTTAGMMAANLPAVIFGKALMRRLPMEALHKLACVLFVGIGVYGLVKAL